jgi:hypothetical protein
VNNRRQAARVFPPTGPAISQGIMEAHPYSSSLSDRQPAHFQNYGEPGKNFHLSGDS